MGKLEELYWLRFSADERSEKCKLWKVLCDDFLSRYIPEDAAVLDLGAGTCDFINTIVCKSKFAVDLNTDTTRHASGCVKVFIANAANLKDIPDESIDVVFASEFFEHLKSNDELYEILVEIRRVLRKSGKLIILAPNIRFLYSRYWDFIDHRLPLSHLSMREALLLYGYTIETMIPKFLPYTTKSRLPKSPLLLKIYLKLPFLWMLFGKQMFVVACK